MFCLCLMTSFWVAFAWISWFFSIGSKTILSLSMFSPWCTPWGSMALLCRKDTSCTMVKCAKLKNDALCAKLQCVLCLMIYMLGCLCCYMLSTKRSLCLEVDTWFQWALTWVGMLCGCLQWSFVKNVMSLYKLWFSGLSSWVNHVWILAHGVTSFYDE